MEVRQEKDIPLELGVGQLVERRDLLFHNLMVPSSESKCARLNPSLLFPIVLLDPTGFS